MIDRAVLCGLVVFIIVYFVKETDGPKDLFFNFRGYLKQDPDGYPMGFFSELFACYWCLSTWVALPVVIVSTLLYPIGSWIMTILSILYIWAASIAVAGTIYTIVDR